MSEKMETMVSDNTNSPETQINDHGGITPELAQKIKEAAERSGMSKEADHGMIEQKKKSIFNKFSEFFTGNPEARLSKLIDSKTTWGITAEEKATIMAEGAKENYAGSLGYNSETGQAYYKPAKDVKWAGGDGGASYGAM